MYRLNVKRDKRDMYIFKEPYSYGNRPVYNVKYVKRVVHTSKETYSYDKKSVYNVKYVKKRHIYMNVNRYISKMKQTCM